MVRWILTMLVAVATIFATIDAVAADVIPISGDLNNDGFDIYGTFDRISATFTFNGKTVSYGLQTDLPIVGDWDNDGKDEIGVFRPNDGGISKLHIVTRDWSSLSGNVGSADYVISFPALYSNNMPVVGNWDGLGGDDIGLFNPNTFYLYTLNPLNLGAPLTSRYKDVPFGMDGDKPLSGDWDNDGIDDLGMFRPQYPNSNTNSFFLDKGLTGYQAELGPYEYGNTGDIPVIGDWDGDGVDNIGVYRPSTYEFFKDTYNNQYEGAIVTNAAYTPKWLLKNNLRQKITNDETFWIIYNSNGNRYYLFGDNYINKIPQGADITYTETVTLSVTTTPVSGSIYVDGIYKGTGSWSGSVNIGSHTVSFGAVSGYTTPSQQTITFNIGGQTATLTGTYVSNQAVLRILDSSVYPNVASPGDTLDFVYSINNPGTTNVNNVRLGARIRTNSPQGVWIDDRPNDKVEIIYPGTRNYNRSYKVNSTASLGLYDAQWVILDNADESKWFDNRTYSPILTIQSNQVTEKSLLKVVGSIDVYWLQNNKLYWVTEAAMTPMTGIPGWGWDNVKVYPSSVFNPASYVNGPRFINVGASSDNLLIRENGAFDVYLISGGKRRHIVSPEVFESKGYNWADVINVSSQILNLFPIGSDISNNPTISVSPISGPQGTNFYYSGSGYTPYGIVEWHVRKPDGVDYLPDDLSGKVDGLGNFNYNYVSTCGNLVGDYTLWSFDKYTGRRSNDAIQTITASSSCTSPPPSIILTSPAPDSYFALSESITFSASVQGGLQPYDYKWKDENGVTIGTIASFGKSDFEAGAHRITLTVTDANLKTTSASMNVFVVKPFRFVQLTDVHIGYDPEWYQSCYNKLGRDIGRFSNYNYCDESYINSVNKLNAVIDSILQLSPKPDFVLITGDLVEWNKGNFFDMIVSTVSRLKQNHIDIYMVPGNHDRRGKENPMNPFDVACPDLEGSCFNDLSNYRNKISNDNNIEIVGNYQNGNYYFNHNGYRFIGLDSGYDFNAKGGNFEDKWLYDNTPEGSGLDDTQRSFLFSAAGASDNNINSKLPKIVFMHHPVIDVKDDSTFDERYPPVKNEDNTYGGNDGTIAKNRVDLIKLSEQYNIPLVLTGHSHKPKFLDSKANLNSRNPNINTEYHFPDFSVANSDISIGLIPNKYPIFVQERSATKDDDSSHGYLVVNVEKNNIFLEDRIVIRKAAPYYTSNTFSPADVHFYDQFGRHTGLNATGQIETNIPDSYYFEEEKLGNITVPATILLYNTTLNYTTKIVSNFSKENITGDQSNFTFTMDKQIGNETITITYDNVSINRNTTTHLQLNSTETNYAMQVDFNNDTTNITPRAPDSIITNYAPTAIISSPADNSTWQRGETIILNRTGDDIEDGILNETTWISDRDDVIGHGNFTTANLSAGIHRITMRINDSAGQINTSSIVLIINDTMPPVLEISYPPENKTFNKQNITVIGIAYDDSGISNVTVNGIQAGQENWNTSLGLNEGENRIDVVATDNKGFSKTANRTVYYNSSLATDTQPPATITNLTHETGYNSVNGAWINWTWNNPKDSDFSYSIVHLDNISWGNTLKSYFNFTGLSSDADYNISILTADIVDNINYSEVKDTVRTPFLDAAPSQSINNPSLQEAGTTWLNFTWFNPLDHDFSHVMLFLNGTFLTNITAPQNYHNFTGLAPDTLYELGTHTVDSSGNVNKTWVNATARTAPDGSTIITVDDSGGADYMRIQDAIDNASDGDTIEVQSGTYFENVNVNKRLTLRGIGMPVVNASGSGSVITLAADGITLEGFTATGNYYGIFLSSSSDNILSYNNASNNYYGIFLSSSSNNKLVGNNAISNTNDGIYLYSSSNNTLISNDASNNYYGIRLSFSSNNMLSGNNASNNHGGIFAYLSSNNTLSSNNASSNNLVDGIFLSSSNNNTLISNIASFNRGIIKSYGINLYNSSNNTIYNNIFNNTNNFYNDLNTNKWNVTKTPGMNIISGSYIGGNFWANPDGMGFSQQCDDSTGDGICDSFYSLDSNNTDYLPLATTTILPTIRYINGTVMDSITKEMLVGVTILTTGTSTTSNASGFYSLEVVSGAYPITAKYDIRYYTNSSMTVSSALSAVVVQDIELVKKLTGNITGSVTKCCTLG